MGARHLRRACARVVPTRGASKQRACHARNTKKSSTVSTSPAVEARFSPCDPNKLVDRDDNRVRGCGHTKRKTRSVIEQTVHSPYYATRLAKLCSQVHKHLPSTFRDARAFGMDPSTVRNFSERRKMAAVIFPNAILSSRTLHRFGLPNGDLGHSEFFQLGEPLVRRTPLLHVTTAVDSCRLLRLQPG
jgi:hypothetical protein